MNKKRGFTLIELLTVVLIIGTLTAIAVPQYRRSIQRSEAIEAMMNLRTIFESAVRYRSEHSEAPTNIKQLDVGFFDVLQYNADNDACEVGNFLYTLNNNSISACRLSGNTHTGANTYCFEIFYNNEDYGGKGAMVCQAQSKKFQAVCPGFGSPVANEDGDFPIYGVDNINKKQTNNSNKPEELVNVQH